MAFTLTWKPNTGSSLVLNTLTYPIDTNWEIDVEWADASVKKMQRPGEHPTFSYPGSMRVSAEGHIIGNSNSDFWLNRIAFLSALTTPNDELTARRHGRLTMNDPDMFEAAYCDARIIHRVANFEPGMPQICPYLVTFKAFTPYWVGVGTGTEYVLG